jgi:nitrogen regulatory protein PII
MEQKKLSLLTVVVQRRLGDHILDVALKAGAAGATYFYAQGTGVRQALGFLGRFIDAEKQVVFVVAEPEKIDAVLDAVVAAGHLDQPGQGFAYVQEVVKAVGFLEGADAAAAKR